MTGRNSTSRAKGKGKAIACSSAIPDVYQNMLAEALPLQSDVPDRPLKRRRTGRQGVPAKSTNVAAETEKIDVDDEDDLEFEDVLLHGEPHDFEDGYFNPPPKSQQTATKGSEEEESASDFEWEAINLDAQLDAGSRGVLELTFSKPASTPKSTSTRRKAVTKEEKALRLQIHRMHVLCFLSYVERRNKWCNDSEVQRSLKPLLSKSTLKFLRPKEDLNQFSRANSLKRGLDEVATLWRTRFRVTSRGIRRALWADDERVLHNVSET
jgi:xeroderma pigmentosum group C-complementing protein